MLLERYCSCSIMCFVFVASDITIPVNQFNCLCGQLWWGAVELQHSRTQSWLLMFILLECTFRLNNCCLGYSPVLDLWTWWWILILKCSKLLVLSATAYVEAVWIFTKFEKKKKKILAHSLFIYHGHHQNCQTPFQFQLWRYTNWWSLV